MSAVHAPKTGMRNCAVSSGATEAPTLLTPTAHPSDPRWSRPRCARKPNSAPIAADGTRKGASATANSPAMPASAALSAMPAMEGVRNAVARHASDVPARSQPRLGPWARRPARCPQRAPAAGPGKIARQRSREVVDRFLHPLRGEPDDKNLERDSQQTGGEQGDGQ